MVNQTLPTPAFSLGLLRAPWAHPLHAASHLCFLLLSPLVSLLFRINASHPGDWFGIVIPSPGYIHIRGPSLKVPSCPENLSSFSQETLTGSWDQTHHRVIGRHTCLEDARKWRAYKICNGNGYF